MQLEQQSQTQTRSQSSTTGWSGTVPSTWDFRVVAFVIVVAGLAASLNVPSGGPVVAGVAFAILAVGGLAGHLHGARTLRRLTDGVVDQWADSGGQIEDVTRSTKGIRTEWVVHTPETKITVGGLALTPISRFTVSWDGVSEGMAATDADDDGELERVAEEWFREIFDHR